MIIFENTEVTGWEHAIRGMRNPMNAWDQIDSEWVHDYAPGTEKYELGPKDLKRALNLAKAGSDHAKYRRMIVVYVDITAPLYWWKEFDTYKVGTVANSCSTMHKIHEKEFTLGDFSHEHLSDEGDEGLLLGDWIPLYVLQHIINVLNKQREKYLDTEKRLTMDINQERLLELRSLKKKYWWQIIQLLPSSYNQRRTVMLNYEVLSNIYKSRKGHRLDEWEAFRDWIVELPYSELITVTPKRKHQPYLGIKYPEFKNPDINYDHLKKGE